MISMQNLNEINDLCRDLSAWRYRAARARTAKVGRHCIEVGGDDFGGCFLWLDDEKEISTDMRAAAISRCDAQVEGIETKLRALGLDPSSVPDDEHDDCLREIQAERRLAEGNRS